MKKLLKWPPTVALLVCLTSCMSLMAPGGELKGLDVEKVTEVLRTLADEVEKYDVNKDGLITRDEVPPLALSLGSRLYHEMRRR